MAHPNAGPKRWHRARGGHLPDERPRLVRQHRLNGGPPMLAEFVAHDSRLRFRSLKDPDAARVGHRSATGGRFHRECHEYGQDAAPRRPTHPGASPPPTEFGRGSLRLLPMSRKSQVTDYDLVLLASDFIAEHGAKQLPPISLEPSELDLLDRSEISRTGVDRDARQQVIGSEVL